MDENLRTFIIHGVRSVLARASQQDKVGTALNILQRRASHTKVIVAPANKFARIAYGVWKYQREFEPQRTAACRFHCFGCVQTSEFMTQ